MFQFLKRLHFGVHEYITQDSSYEHFSGSFEVDYNNYIEKKGCFILACNPVVDAGFLEGGSVIITRAKRARNF